MKKTKFAVLILGVLLFAAACNKAADNTNPSPTPPATSGEAQSGEVTVTIKDGKYTPNTVTVKSGTKVTFVNDDSSPRWPASNPHPTHTDLPGFDSLKGLAKGESYSFTFTQLGTWKYHDHLFPSNGGSVVVVQ